MILLTICIPTYNFGSYIEATLNSIISQVTDEVEVLIFDGGSDDNTAEVALSKQNLIRNFNYHKQPYRGGVDRDIESAVCLANGLYCWLISADDIVLSGAIEKILIELRAGYDLYICEHTNHIAGLEDATPYPMFNKDISCPYLFDTRISFQANKYFEAAVTSEPFFSFLSTPIFKRNLWVNTTVSEEIYGTCWIVAGKLLPVMCKGALVYYMHKTLLSKRSTNQSHIFSNTLSQFRIIFINLPKVVGLYYPENSISRAALRRILRLEVPLKFLLRTKYEACKLNHDLSNIMKAADAIYFDGNFNQRIMLSIVKIAPCFLLNLAKNLASKFK